MHVPSQTIHSEHHQIVATKPKPPKRYTVILHNDDFTPMDFVVWIVQTVFLKSLSESTHIMLTIHHHGKGICGTYPHDIAKTKTQKVQELAKAHQHPLKCSMEPVQ